MSLQLKPIQNGGQLKLTSRQNLQAAIMDRISVHTYELYDCFSFTKPFERSVPKIGIAFKTLVTCFWEVAQYFCHYLFFYGNLYLNNAPYGCVRQPCPKREPVKAKRLMKINRFGLGLS